MTSEARQNSEDGDPMIKATSKQAINMKRLRRKNEISNLRVAIILKDEATSGGQSDIRDEQSSVEDEGDVDFKKRRKRRREDKEQADSRTTKKKNSK
jgi:hypothetical protein